MKRLAVILMTLLAVGAANAAEPARLPDGLLAEGANDIAEAWLTRPTDRYPHAILGDAIEAGGLMVKRASDGKLIELVLPDEFVFEDRSIRLRDLDGDGRDEIIVVLSSRTEGGALAIYGLEGGKIVKRAQTPHIGRANRWLNPAEIADLDGDDWLDIVFVRTPHLGKVVEVWNYARGKLTKVTELKGYSNHVIGSSEQDLTAVPYSLKQASPLLAIPTADYSAFAFLRLKNGKLSEVARVAAGGKINSKVELSADGKSVVREVAPKTNFNVAVP